MSVVMAVAVEPSHLSSSPLRERNEKNFTKEFEIQTAEIVHQTIHSLLFDKGVRLNGFTNGMVEPKFSTDETKRAFLSLKGACKQFMKLHSREIADKANQIVVSDTMVCAAFHKTMYSIFEDDINWGRVVALFCFSAAIALKAYEDNKFKTIDSIEGWMTTFINDNLQDWILKHHGWVSKACC